MAGSRLAAFLQVAAFVMPEVAAVERMGRGGGGGGGGWGGGGGGVNGLHRAAHRTD